MYRRVPPPEHNQELRASAEEKAEEVDESKPENVASDQWKVPPVSSSVQTRKYKTVKG